MTDLQEEEERKAQDAQTQLLDILHSSRDDDAKTAKAQREYFCNVNKIAIEAVIAAAKAGNVTCITALMQILMLKP